MQEAVMDHLDIVSVLAEYVRSLSDWCWPLNPNVTVKHMRSRLEMWLLKNICNAGRSHWPAHKHHLFYQTSKLRMVGIYILYQPIPLHRERQFPHSLVKKFNTKPQYKLLLYMTQYMCRSGRRWMENISQKCWNKQQWRHLLHRRLHKEHQCRQMI